MPNFTGQLNSNEIFNVLFNMIISQQVFTDNVNSDNRELVSRAKVDGTLYGDTKLYISTDVIRTHEWGNDGEAQNLLKLDRPTDPDVQAIVINKFRQIPLTTDNYLSKRAFMDEGTFIQFNSTVIGWLSDTKLIFDETLYNSFIGTNETSIGLQEQTVELPSIAGLSTMTEKNQGYQLRSLLISRAIENLGDDLAKPNRKFNDYGNLRKIGKQNLTIVINSKYANEFEKIDIKGIFHNENIVPDATKLHADYFGTINTTAGTAPTPNTNVYSLIEVDFNVDGNGNLLPMNDPNYDKAKHIFPGDLWPAGVAYAAGDTYTRDDTIICKVIGGRLPPLMSAFQVETVFFNARSLTDTHFLTWGYNELEHLHNYPYITIRETNAE